MQNPYSTGSGCNSWLTRGLVITYFLIISVVMQNALVPVQDWMRGIVRDGDAAFNGYVLCWAMHSLTGGGIENYYNPPISYPETHMSYMTDGMEFPALMMLPFWIITNNSFLLVNMMVVISHFTTLMGFYWLVRRTLELDRILAVIAATFFALCSDRLYHAEGHFNLIWSGLLPVIFGCTWIYANRGDVKLLFGLTATLGLSAYCSFYFFVFSAYVFLSAIILWIVANKGMPIRGVSVRLSLIIPAALFLVMPKILLYLAAGSSIEGTGRNSLAEADLFKASWRGYFVPSQELSGISSIVNQPKEVFRLAENNQFLGYLLIVIILMELIRLCIRGKRRRCNMLDRLSLYSILFGAIFLLVSFGPRYAIIGVSPYKIFYYLGLKYTEFYRIPGRFAFLVQFFFVLSASIWMYQNFSKRFKAQIICFAVCVPIIIFEHLPLFHPALFYSNPGLINRMDNTDPARIYPYIDLSRDMLMHCAFESVPDWRPTGNGYKRSILSPDFDNRYFAFKDFPTTSTVGWMATNNIPWIITTSQNQLTDIVHNGTFDVVATDNDRKLLHFKHMEKVAEQYKELLDKLATDVSIQREETTPTLLSTEDAIVTPSKNNIYEYLTPIAKPHDLSVHVNFDVIQPIVPSNYDIVRLTYQIPEQSRHQARFYWRTKDTPFDGRRFTTGTVELVDAATKTYIATFTPSHDHNWMTDSSLSQLHIELHHFENLKENVVTILSTEFSRSGKPVVVPEI